MVVVNPVLQATYRQSTTLDVSECPCAQILGFDILLDNKFQLHLLEVNNSPSLSLDEVIEV